MLAVWNCPICEVVNIVKGTYCMLPKASGTRPPPPLPTGENARVFVTVGKDADLNKAMDTAPMAMIDLLVQRKSLSRLDAYALASTAMDCRIAPPKTAEKQVHCMMPKSPWTGQG
jgi:acetamidase/formamidase